MSFEDLSGPQKVSEAANRLAQCPHLSIAVPELQDLSPSDRVQDRLIRFGLAKLVSDEVAERLPNMSIKYPPYGLPKLYREDHMESPAWRTVQELDVHQVDGASPIQAGLSVLRDLYKSKMIVHVYDELEDMQADTLHGKAIFRLGELGKRNFMGERTTTVEGAYEFTGRPAVDNSDTIFGLMAVVAEVLEQQFDRTPSHDELIASLKMSKRLPILGSLLSRGQLNALLVGTAKNNNPLLKGWGFDLDPRQFTVHTTKDGDDMYVDYKDGISGVLVPSYTEDRGEFGAAFLPTTIVDSTKSPQRLDELRGQREVLTCPSRRFIGAMWQDIIEIADASRLFDTPIAEQN